MNRERKTSETELERSVIYYIFINVKLITIRPGGGMLGTQYILYCLIDILQNNCYFK